jgi:hypothetical protein
MLAKSDHLDASPGGRTDASPSEATSVRRRASQTAQVAKGPAHHRWVWPPDKRPTRRAAERPNAHLPRTPLQSVPDAGYSS